MNLIQEFQHFQDEEKSNAPFQTQFYVHTEQIPIAIETQLLRIENGNAVLGNSIPFAIVKDFAESKNFVLQGGIWRFTSNTITACGDTFLFPLHYGQKGIELRKHKRARYSLGQSYCTFLNPFDQQTWEKKEIYDFHEGGCSLLTIQGSKIFSPTTFYPQLSFFLQDKSQSQAIFSGISIYCREILTLSGKFCTQCGIKFIERHK